MLNKMVLQLERCEQSGEDNAEVELAETNKQKTHMRRRMIQTPSNLFQCDGSSAPYEIPLNKDWT
jgi:hypothetical protein